MLPPEADSSIAILTTEEKPDVTYSDIIIIIIIINYNQVQPLRINYLASQFKPYTWLSLNSKSEWQVNNESYIMW